MTQHPATQRSHPPGPGADATVLPDELFARLLGGSVRHGAFAGESRGAPRVVLNRRAAFRRYGPGAPEQGHAEACTVRDLSVSGVSLLVEGRIESGQAFVLVVKDPAGAPAALPCVVVRSRPAGVDSRRFIVGARFTRDLPRPTPGAAPAAVPRAVADPLHAVPVVPRADASAAEEVERIRAAMFNG